MAHKHPTLGNTVQDETSTEVIDSKNAKLNDEKAEVIKTVKARRRIENMRIFENLGVRGSYWDNIDRRIYSG